MDCGGTVNPPLKGKNLADEPFTVTGLNDPATIALAPRGTPLYQTTYGNVAPRIGVAYQLAKQVIGLCPARRLRNLLRSWLRLSSEARPATSPTEAVKIIPARTFPSDRGECRSPGPNDESTRRYDRWWPTLI